jgi:predicted RND superfamily exporter protein
MAVAMFEVVVRFRVLVLLAAAAITAAFATQLPKLVLEPDTEAYVPEDHPSRTYWREAKDRFGLGREILVAVQAEGGDGVFAPEILATITKLTAVIETVDGVSAVDVRSISNSEAMVGTADGLEVMPFFEDPPITREESQLVRKRVFENPVFLDRLISRDGTIAAIFVKTEGDADDAPEVYARLMTEIEKVPVGNARLLVAGNPAIEYVYGRQMAHDLQRLIPLALATVVFILYLCFPSPGPRVIVLRAVVLAAVIAAAMWGWGGSVSAFGIALAAPVLAMLTAPGVLLPCIVVVMAVIWTWGAQAVLGLPIYIAGTLVPPLLLAIGSADGIHIVGRFFELASRPGADKKQAIVATMNQLWRPIILTSTTTAAGFGSLALGQMTVYQVFGVTTAFGVLTAMVASMFVLPAMLSVLPLVAMSSARTAEQAAPGAEPETRLSKVLVGLAERLEGHRTGILVGSLLATLVLLWSASRLQVDYSWVESLAPGTPVLEADRVLREHHGGTMPFNVIVRAAEPDGIKDPELLRAMDAMLDDLSKDPIVGDTRSLSEYIKRMSQAMNEDRLDAFRIPDSRDLIAQYLLFYSMSGDPGEYDDLVDYDYQASNLSVLLRTDRLSALRRVLAEVERLLDQHIRSLGATATVTGSASILDVVFTMVLSSQIQSLATTAVMCLIFLALLFRSLRDALVCMVPLAITTVANFGIMSAFGIPLGPDKAMIGAIALGIGIDYSIHLMSRFRDTLDEGMGVFQGIVEAVRTTGRSILFNGIVVVAGFVVIGSSETPSNATFGLVIAGNIALACISAMVVLPAALAVLGHRELRRARRAPVRIAGRLIDARTARALGIEGETG